jgi:hypothetical protein
MSASQTNSSGCTVLMKTGERKNQPCGATVVSGTNCCKRHTIKDASTTTPKVKEEIKKETQSSISSSVSEGCTILMKSGERKNQPCGATVVSGTNCCKRHTVKEPSASTPKIPKVKEENKKVKSSNAVTEGKPVFEIIESRRTLFHVMKNKFNNYEHKETGFVFDKNTDEVIGKQHLDGTIVPLTLNDIELCKENNWSFKPPLKVLDDSNIIKKQTVTVEDDDDYNEEDEEDEEELE